MSRSDYKPHDGKTDREMLQELYDRVVGDGTEENPGLTMRVDRLEQTDSKRRNLTLALLAGGAATFLLEIWNLVKGK